MLSAVCSTGCPVVSMMVTSHRGSPSSQLCYRARCISSHPSAVSTSGRDRRSAACSRCHCAQPSNHQVSDVWRRNSRTKPPLDRQLARLLVNSAGRQLPHQFGRRRRIVADLGCGTGDAPPALRKAVGPTGVIGIDRTPQMLAATRPQADNSHAAPVLVDTPPPPTPWPTRRTTPCSLPSSSSISRHPRPTNRTRPHHPFLRPARAAPHLQLAGRDRCAC
jgi:hypothetical protein